MRERLVAFQDQVYAQMNQSGDFDRELFEKEVRQEMSKYLPRKDVDSYFDVFSPSVDWDGMQFYLERRDLENS